MVSYFGRYKKVPIFVPCFNTVSYTRSMVRQLRARGYKNIVLLDNASTYPPMLEFLSDPGKNVRVSWNASNKGPRHILMDPSVYETLPDLFCLTDPDIVFGHEMPASFVADLAEISESWQLGKIGLAISIDDRKNMRADDFLIEGKTYKIWEWEAQFWQNQVGATEQGDPIYDAMIDTTFALYNKKYFNPGRDMFSALRLAGRYTCRHLPWYHDNGLLAEEEAFYKKHATKSFYLRSDYSLEVETG